jgi:hypothetical protein
MEQPTDAFKAMILREFFLEPRLAEEFQAARVLSWAGDKLAWPLSKVVATKFGIPAKPVELAVRAITGERFTALPVRSASDILAWFKSPDDNYRSCCRSALCYAVTGSREWAFGALRVAASKHDDWARHRHLYGMIPRGLRRLRQGPARAGEGEGGGTDGGRAGEDRRGHRAVPGGPVCPCGRRDAGEAGAHAAGGGQTAGGADRDGRA